MLAEFNAVRTSIITMYQSFKDESLKRIGIVPENPMSVRALGYLTARHMAYHLNVFQERYL